MTKYGSDKVAWFLVAGLDVVGTLTEFEDSLEAKTEESHGLGDAWVENQYVGVKAAEITQQGFYDDVVGGLHDALSSGPGETNILSYTLEGTATGTNFVAWSAGVQVTYQRQAERDGLTKARATYRNGGAGVIENGKTVFPWQNVGAVASGGGWLTQYDLGTATAGAAVGYLQYNMASGEANIKLVQSASVGGASFTGLLNFTKISAGHGAERMETTVALKRYITAFFTTASATGDLTNLTAFVGLVRK